MIGSLNCEWKLMLNRHRHRYLITCVIRSARFFRGGLTTMRDRVMCSSRTGLLPTTKILEENINFGEIIHTVVETFTVCVCTVCTAGFCGWWCLCFVRYGSNMFETLRNVISLIWHRKCLIEKRIGKMHHDSAVCLLLC